MDFFTPVVDDPFAYGQIAAANALSDVYAMGGKPLTVMNIACFDPDLAPPDVWAEILRGMAEKTIEAGAVCVGGHTIVDKEPKFGMSVTGIVDPDRIWTNAGAKVGDDIWLSKPLGTGIVTTAAKFDKCTADELQSAVESMSRLSRSVCEAVQRNHDDFRVACATDITGYGLGGHLYNIVRGSNVNLEIDHASLPLLPGVQRMVADGCTTAGADRNAEFVGSHITFAEQVPTWIKALTFDPQTSGGLAILSKKTIPGAKKIGRVVEGPAAITVI